MSQFQPRFALRKKKEKLQWSSYDDVDGSNAEALYDPMDGKQIQVNVVRSKTTTEINRDPALHDSAYGSGHNSLYGTLAYPSPSMHPQQTLPMAAYHHTPATYEPSDYTRPQQVQPPALYSLAPVQYRLGNFMHPQQFQSDTLLSQDPAQYGPTPFAQYSSDQPSNAVDHQDQFDAMSLDLPPLFSHRQTP